MDDLTLVIQYITVNITLAQNICTGTYMLKICMQCPAFPAHVEFLLWNLFLTWIANVRFPMAGLHCHILSLNCVFGHNKQRLTYVQLASSHLGDLFWQKYIFDHRNSCCSQEYRWVYLLRYGHALLIKLHWALTKHLPSDQCNGVVSPSQLDLNNYQGVYESTIIALATPLLKIFSILLLQSRLWNTSCYFDNSGWVEN